MNYECTLTNAMGDLTYERTSFAADSQQAALEKASLWISTLETNWPEAWLMMNVEGRMMSFRPGEF